MMIFLKNEGYTDEELVRLNRVRCHQQILFYSQTLLIAAGVDPFTANTGQRGRSGRSGLTLFFQTKNLQEKTSDYGTMQSIA
jgi:hypothetical protein